LYLIVKRDTGTNRRKEQAVAAVPSATATATMDNGGGNSSVGSPNSQSGKKKKFRVLKKLGRVVGIGRRKSGTSGGDDGSSVSGSDSQYSEDILSDQQQQQQQQQQQPSTQEQLQKHFSMQQDNMSVDRNILDQVIEEESESEEEEEEDAGNTNQRSLYSTVKSSLMMSKKSKELPHDHVSDEALAKTGNSLASTTKNTDTSSSPTKKKDGTPTKTKTKTKTSPSKKKSSSSPSSSPKKTKQKSPTKKSAGGSPAGKQVGRTGAIPVSLVVLLVDPVSLRFELLQLSFETPSKVSVETALQQASQNVTEPILKGLKFASLLDGTGQFYDGKATIATAVSKSVASSPSSASSTSHKVLLVAALPDTPAESLTKLTRPILADPKVVSMLKGQGYHLAETGWIPTTQQKQREAVLDKNMTSSDGRYRPRKTILGMPISLAFTIGFVIVLNLFAFLVIYGSRWYAAQQHDDAQQVQVGSTSAKSREMLLREEASILSFLGVAGMAGLTEALGDWTTSLKKNVVEPTTAGASSLYTTILSMSGSDSRDDRPKSNIPTSPSVSSSSSTFPLSGSVISDGNEKSEDGLDLN